MKRIIVVALSVLMALIIAAPIASAQHASQQKSDLGELAAGWWEWALKKPTQVNPLIGSYTWPEQPRAGAKCAGGSSLGVWNLAGTLDGSTVTRTCHAPAGKEIFFSALNVITIAPKGTETEEQLRQQVNDFIDQIQADPNFSVFATVDGEDVPIQRADSPLFRIHISQNNVFYPFLPPDYAAPPRQFDAVADGFWVLLPPLPPGEHTIHFGGSAPSIGFTQDNTYILTVN